MRTQKEKFDSMQRMYDNACPPEPDVREEAFEREFERAENEISDDPDKLSDAVTDFLALSCREGWPEEYPNLDSCFQDLIENAIYRRRVEQANPFTQICDAAANWAAKRLVTEMFKDK
jgi:hypothetical protein